MNIKEKIGVGMFEVLKWIPLMVAGNVAIEEAKKIGLVPVNLLSINPDVVEWKKEREYTGWQNDVLNPNSKFYTTINVGDGKKTVGWGLTESMNHVYPSDCKIYSYGQKFTFDQINRMYEAVKKEFENKTKFYLKGLSVPSGVFSAVTSALYNTGEQLFKNSNGSETQFYKALKSKDFEKARRNFTWWKMNGQVTKGLVARRMGEHAFFVGKKPKSHSEYLLVWQEYANTFNKDLL